MKKEGQSFIDTLIQLMPGLMQNKFISHSKDFVNSAAADSLFSVWKNSSTKGKTFVRPRTMSMAEVKNMEDEGLVKAVGSNLEITSKGEKVIKVMILGDSRSIFEDNDVIIDYNQALSNTNNVKTAKKSKVANSWWDRFDK